MQTKMQIPMQMPPATGKDTPDAAVVTPATGERARKNERARNGRDAPSSIETAALVREWIRSTLLEQPPRSEGVVSASAPLAAFSGTKVLAWPGATKAIHVKASFAVYASMVPQIAGISPALVGHVFRVAGGLVRDAYHERIAVVLVPGKGGASNCDGNARARVLLNHLAASAMGLLRACWEAGKESSGGIGASGEKAAHRTFLLLSLQELLGDLLVPLPLSELPREHYRLAVRGLARRKQRERDWHERQQREQEKQREQQQEQQQGPRHPRYSGACFGLDPESKLLLRMAVYRLLVD